MQRQEVWGKQAEALAAAAKQTTFFLGARSNDPDRLPDQPRPQVGFSDPVFDRRSKKEEPFFSSCFCN
ncbi:hypothetical protein QT971_16305 [Microcoleus sp. herbarium19]|uniref:hypothetical protein n=1 Tax=unclassified Microcoleus TaxID=2642155 RepID=UPI002FD113ED